MNTTLLEKQNRITELLNKLTIDPDREELRNMVYDRKNEKILLELPIIDFFRSIVLCSMSAQKYGFLIQRKIVKDLKFGKQIDRNSGDASKDGRPEEIKCSLITGTNQGINIRQIRDWQGCDYTICGVDMRILDNPIIYFFQLTHDDMKRELECCKIVSNSHGTDESNQENLNIEKSITIRFDENDVDFQRWCKNYRQASPWDNELISNA